MDRSKRRADRQLRLLQGRHIMRWRQTWLLSWTPHPERQQQRIDQMLDREERA